MIIHTLFVSLVQFNTHKCHLPSFLQCHSRGAFDLELVSVGEKLLQKSLVFTRVPHADNGQNLIFVQNCCVLHSEHAICAKWKLCGSQSNVSNKPTVSSKKFLLRFSQIAIHCFAANVSLAKSTASCLDKCSLKDC